MIVRKEPDSTILIAQTEHSRLVGQFAAHWGNDNFATPRPWESVARAAAFHDFGWLRYETAPHFDPETGETPPFYRAPGGTRQLDSYQWCIDGLLADDPYAGLLVGMHRTGLWRGRYGALSHPPHAIPPKLPPAIEDFIAREEPRQAQAREAFDAAERFIIEVMKKDKPRRMDLKGSVFAVAMASDSARPVFHLTINQQPGSFVKPHDALAAILGRAAAMGIDVRAARTGFEMKAGRAGVAQA